jgi:hypothetical protein
MIKAYDVEIPKHGGGYNKESSTFTEIMTFLESGYNTAEIEVMKGEKASTVKQRYLSVVRHHRLGNDIGVFCREDRVFLVRREY